MKLIKKGVRVTNEAFLERTPREKFLVVFFLVTMVLLWGLNFLNRSREDWQTWQQLERTYEQQQVWIDNAEMIGGLVEEEIGRLERDQLLSRTRLLSEINRLARAQDLSPSIDTPRTEEGEIFQFHTVTVRLSRSPMERIIAFTDSIQDRSPYMSMGELILIPDRNDPRNLEARYEITAVEISDEEN
ncbi:MAG: hypothetical protein JJT75_10845 [Opitutales bacterium]|nr:hypothetical protein [Opitutales bacterium]MCH8539524.1 hypothetical protein [Opitutales bacterium]